MQLKKMCQTYEFFYRTVIDMFACGLRTADAAFLDPWTDSGSFAYEKLRSTRSHAAPVLFFLN